MIITNDWIMSHMTRGGSWKAKQLAAIGVTWPPRQGWKDRAIGQSISDEQQQLFESFAGPKIRAITGSLYRPSGDCNQCCVPWEICPWPCPDAINQENA